MRSSTQILTSGRLVAWPVAAVVFLLPWQARLIYRPAYINSAFWEYGSLSVYALEVVVWACLGAAVLQAFRKGVTPWPRFSLRRFLTPAGMVFGGALGLVLSAWLSLAWALDRTVALQAAFRLTEAVALMFVVLNAAPRVRANAAVAWAAAAALQGALATAQFLTQGIGGSTWLGVDPQSGGELGASVVELAGGRWLRAYGTFPHPNILAGFLAVGVLLAGAWYVRQYQTAQRVAALACGVVASLGLAFTFSRSGAAALAAGWLAWVVSSAWRRRNLLPAVRFVGLSVLAFLAAAAWVAPQAGTRALGAGRLEVKSLTERRALLGEGVVLAQRWLPRGVGIGQATVASIQRDPLRPGFAYQPPHHVPLLVSIELGVDGLLLAVLLAGGMVVYAWRSSGIGLGLLASLALIGWFDHYLWTLVPGVLMAWLAAGLTLGNLEEPAG